MSDAYRKNPDGDPLGEPERESAAVAAFGKWRDRTRMLILVLFALPGVGLGAVAWWFVQEYQFDHNRGRASLFVNVVTAAVAWGIMFAAGAFLGRLVVRSKTPSRLAMLARDYDVPITKLQETATMVDKL